MREKDPPQVKILAATRRRDGDTVMSFELGTEVRDTTQRELGVWEKHAPWLVLAKNLESKFKGHLIPVPGQKVAPEARGENEE